MATKKPNQPMVTSAVTRLRRNVLPTQVVSPEEVMESKRTALDLVYLGLDQFKANLEQGRVSFTTSSDLERLIKLMLTLSGEADTIQGRPHGELEEEATLESIAVATSKAEDILSLDDPEVAAIYDKLYDGYNEANDADGDQPTLET